ncbi:hypothetical protein R69619_01708 [Paraburkholderia nemoris]|uniref:hypothetical protein n=1 Tax=Paraburkholderia nemoris TaxID=2793076 RepID=UPI00190A21FC|nr:hypothetical protein [Paraburkholderia nemoris]MBK3740254.1 hypothetical protein [Paraburkholderia aspalathi]CAE6724331.1 hypothetical protein R69619_01708 [Paraburkholderia nemoris]
MTTLAEKPFNFGASLAGASDAARSLNRIMVDNVAALRADPAERRRAFDELEEIRRDATEPNWDGLGSAPLDDATYALALRFLWALPTGSRMPEITVDRDGEVSFDWLGAEGRNFSASLRADGRIAYAGQFSAQNRISGVAEFHEVIPKEVLAGAKQA